MQHRSHVHARGAAAALALTIAATLAASCSDASRPDRSAGLTEFKGGPSAWVGCEGQGRKFTGGGRVDPVDVGKVTFGFNIHGEEWCDGTGPVKGQMEVVYHYNQTLYHTLTMEHFATWTDPELGECADWDGLARSKHVDDGGDWHEHHYTAQVCDNGEPGRDDTFQFLPDGEPPQHQNVWATKLTGGNIQAHK